MVTDLSHLSDWRKQECKLKMGYKGIERENYQLFNVIDSEKDLITTTASWVTIPKEYGTYNYESFVESKRREP